MKLRTVLLTICFVIGALATETSAQTRVVTGQVTDAASGGGIDGARVMIRGTTISTTTEADGTFTIGVPAGDVEIMIARIGYKRAVVTLGATRNTVQVTLEADVFELEEIVVTGRGTGIERRNLANAVATVSGANVTRVAAQSIEHALQGRVAGADVQTNSGAPGGGAQIRLRGVTTLSASSSPLYVVDGVIISNVAIPSNQNAVTRAAGGSNASSTQDGQVNRVVDLNPNDIENIEILKGASASAIYGSKASNGVIIITTKRGRSGRPQLRVSQKFGYFDLSHKLGFRPFADAAAVDAALGAGTAAAVGFTGQTFDYEQQLYGRNALSFESQLSASGGDDNTTYFVSALWKEDEGIAENTGFDKQSFRVNIDQEFSDRLSATVSSNILHTLARRGLQNNDNAGVSPYMVFPFTPNIVDLRRRADGTFPDNPFERSNPLATMARLKNDEDVWRLISSGRLEFNAIQGTNHSLDVIGQGGVDFFSQQNDLFFPPDLQFEDDDGFAGTSLLTNSDNTNINLNANVIHTYTPSGGGSVFTTSTGVTYETRDLTTASIQSQGQIAGQEGIAAGVKSTLAEIRQRAEDFGFYVQEEVLTLDERLLLTAGIRGDQTSRNSEDDKVFYYPKAAASFRFPNLGGFVDELKIRSAYGETGNQPLFGQKFTPLGATSNIEGIPGILIQGNVGSTDLKPERQREIEGGFDALLFGGRATLEFTLFQKNVSDLIITRALAASSGFASQVFNGAELRTRGAEAALGIVPIQTQNFNWLLRTTFGLTRSKITELQVPAFIPANAGFGVGLGSFKIEEGKSATQIVGNLADGSGVGQIGDANPDFKIGISNDITIGDFSVFAHGDWQKGGDIVNLTQLLYDAGGNSIDFDAAGSDRISNFGGDTKIYVQDASFFKMREVSLAWQLPPSVTSSIWGALQDARLSLSARNLFTITDYAGTDPEVSNFGNQSVGRNIDVAPFPPSRSFWFSIDVGF